MTHDLVCACVCLAFADVPEVPADAEVPAGTPPGLVCHIMRAAADKSLKPEHLHSRVDMPGEAQPMSFSFPLLLQQAGPALQ